MKFAKSYLSASRRKRRVNTLVYRGRRGNIGAEIMLRMRVKNLILLTSASSKKWPMQFWTSSINYKEQRDAAVKAYREAYKAWQTWKPSEQQKERPPAPSYTGPSELDFRIAKQCVKTRQWYFERLQKKFAKTSG